MHNGVLTHISDLLLLLSISITLRSHSTHPSMCLAFNPPYTAWIVLSSEDLSVVLFVVIPQIFLLPFHLSFFPRTHALAVSHFFALCIAIDMFYGINLLFTSIATTTKTLDTQRA